MTSKSYSIFSLNRLYKPNLWLIVVSLSPNEHCSWQTKFCVNKRGQNSTQIRSGSFPGPASQQTQQSSSVFHRISFKTSMGSATTRSSKVCSPDRVVENPSLKWGNNKSRQKRNWLKIVELCSVAELNDTFNKTRSHRWKSSKIISLRWIGPLSYCRKKTCLKFKSKVASPRRRRITFTKS